MEEVDHRRGRGEGSRDVFVSMSEHDDVRRHVKDLKSVQNKFAYCTKEGHDFRGNAADEIQAVFSDYLVNSKDGKHDWIRSIKMVSGEVMIVLATDRQIDDIRKFCQESSETKVVLSVDKTYRLSMMLVTVTCYSHPYLEWKNMGDKTSRNPTLLGKAKGIKVQKN